MVASGEAWEFLPCVAIVDEVSPTSHVRPAAVQPWAATALAEVEGILSEDTSTINSAMAPATP
jgi:hypothetical protein